MALAASDAEVAVDREGRCVHDRELGPSRAVLLDPKIPLDNNATERGIRGPVVGRKNHYGSRSRAGTQVAATMYSILETAKLYDLDVMQYLVDAARAADAGHAPMPWDIAR